MLELFKKLGIKKDIDDPEGRAELLKAGKLLSPSVKTIENCRVIALVCGWGGDRIEKWDSADKFIQEIVSFEEHSRAPWDRPVSCLYIGPQGSQRFGEIWQVGSPSWFLRESQVMNCTPQGSFPSGSSVEKGVQLLDMRGESITIRATSEVEEVNEFHRVGDEDVMKYYPLLKFLHQFMSVREWGTAYVAERAAEELNRLKTSIRSDSLLKVRLALESCLQKGESFYPFPSFERSWKPEYDIQYFRLP